MTTTRTYRRRLGAGAAVFLAYGWWLTSRQPFSESALVAVLIAAAALVVLAEIHRERGSVSARDAATRAAPAFRPAIAVWSVAVSALVAWELLALGSSPRSEHPTISSFVETAEHHHLARLGFYALWIALGWAIAS